MLGKRLGILFLCCCLLAAWSSVQIAARAAPNCASASHRGGDWPMYGHDYDNTRAQEKEKKIDPTNAATLTPSWVFAPEDVEASGDFTGTPVVVDGCVYVANNDGWVFALNADNGKLVWKSKLKKGGANGTVGIADGRVFVNISRVGQPYMAALDQDTGKLLWQTTIEKQVGSDVYSSPIEYRGLVFTGWSGGSAELNDESERYPFQGGFVLIDAATGEIVKKTYTIRPPDKNPEKPKDLYAGGAIWSTPAIDSDGYAYAGTGNPFRPQKEHKYTNAILKIDLDRSRPTFGEIVDHLKGVPDEYLEAMKRLPCVDIPNNPPPYYPQGLGACSDLDMDFGASANLWRHKGKTYVGEGQKAGVYHVADTANMKPVWSAVVGPPSAVGGIVGSTAFADKNVYGPITVPGYLWALDSNGGYSWFTPVADGAHWGNPVSVANGVVYTIDLRGFLNGYDARTGVQVLAFPLWFGGGSGLKASWGGVSIARNTVYANTGITGSDGFVYAFTLGE